MEGVERLYHNYEILSNANDKILEHEKEYTEILEAVKGTNKEKKLASQFIGRFFKFFPEKADFAIDAQLDLCEDDDISIRKQAIKDLPTLCKENKENLPKIADVLTQLLQTDDNQELIVVNNSLMTLFKLDAKGTLGGLFSQILTAEDLIRDRAIKFLASKLKSMSTNVMTNEIEEYILNESQKVLSDVTGEEFVTFMTILSCLKISKTLSGQQTLMKIVIDQAELEKPFEHTDPDCIDKLIQCIKQASPLFSPYAPSTTFLKYLTLQVLPVIGELSSNDAEESQNVTGSSIELFQLLAEMSPHCENLDTEDCISKVYDKLLELMPLPPSEENAEKENELESKLEFSSVECLMYTLHQLGKKNPDYLNIEKNPERMKDFRIRLQYFARHVQGYVKELREILQKNKAETENEETKLKIVALKTTSNINSLIRNLFHNPPSYKANITLSWSTQSVKRISTPEVENGSSVAPKRSNITPITFDSDSPSAKKSMKSHNREIYMPPSGKYSDKVSKFHGESGRGSFNRGRRFGNRGRY